MSTTGQHRRRVGAVRPSHLMFTSGVGALVDLPNFSVLVRGIDDWSHENAEVTTIAEPRLLAGIRRLRDMRSVEELRPAPWADGLDSDPRGPAARVGVPVVPFPGWLRCTVCDELAPAGGTVFGFENDVPSRPHDARFFHAECPRKKGGRRPLAVAARFVLACGDGHLDDFPYRHFVHHGAQCEKTRHPRLRMQDRGGNLGANVAIACLHCDVKPRNIREAMGPRGKQNLPRCRGRHPHLSTYDAGCDRETQILVVGASNQWFARTLSALAVPRTGASELAAKVEKNWTSLEGLPQAMLPYARANVPALAEFQAFDDDELWAAIEAQRAIEAAEVDEEQEEGYPDLHTAEWEIFSAEQAPPPSTDFTLHRPGVPEVLGPILDDVVQAERLREVRALVGFTRLDAPDPDDPNLVTPVRLSRDELPSWVPASEVRGEGLFLRLPEERLRAWEAEVAESEALKAHERAYGLFREKRRSSRLSGPFDPMAFWPGARYLAMHTFAHLMVRAISIECGYSSASLSERIYASSDPDDPRSGILIYTAVPDAEGTLGGLVSLGEERDLIRLVRRALRDALRCSSDPLCAERLPAHTADFLHGAACHVCLFVSETTCERGNRFLDRRFVVPIDPATPALFPDLP